MAALLGAVGVLGPPVVEALVTKWEETPNPAPSGTPTPSPEVSSPVPVTDTPDDPPPAPEPVGYDCSPVPGRETVLATVVYTEGLGLNAFCGPANSYPRAQPSNYPESETLTIVCQVRDGQSVDDTDDVPGRYTGAWAVWNKLSNGAWVSDLYVDTPKVEGDTPPEGIPLCEDV
ncbi:hypothetical protein KIK06_17630 [Nocardiopsis sp. EMB25]|uniref:hypothetical protein n=1 Tax=Nocardiopsis sp. EMB25 TaxID=2835867 RepID=UPI002284B07D|nr:hypothetical protein [Nocardiopsis sp. EMB25]MCY9785710.1 hypothetical protein [Nocardiopsis sp. EMB25]